ncbi:Hypothetical_protein [Hexamita inflata]|uniref:Hypothetical_protein n=1 Tax=Hexamita inflata TaxID=28002 RepID=A0ABP1HW20_9EUKA
MSRIYSFRKHIVLKEENKSIFKQIRTKSCFHEEEIRMEFTMQNNKTQTQILCSQYIAEVRFQEQMSLNRKKLIKELWHCFPLQTQKHYALPLIRQIPRFITAIPKIVTKITFEVNNVSSSAELTQVV